MRHLTQAGLTLIELMVTIAIAGILAAVALPAYNGYIQRSKVPVGLDNVAAAIGEEPGTIEDVIEPYLIQQGYLQRTPRGRIATLAAYRHLGLAAPAKNPGDLFG